MDTLLQYCLVVLMAQFGTKASLRTATKRGEDAIALFASTQNIDLDGHDNCTYHKKGGEEVQPDVSFFYLGSMYN